MFEPSHSHEQGIDAPSRRIGLALTQHFTREVEQFALTTNPSSFPLHFCANVLILY